MANYQTLELPSSLLFDQIEEYLSYMYEQSADKSMVQFPIDLIRLSSSIFNNFVNHMGSPISDPLVFSIFPIADDWNKYQTHLHADLKVLYRQYKHLATNAELMAKVDDIETQMLVSAIHTLSNQINSFQLTNTTKELIKRVVSDNFMDTSRIDVKQTTALVTPKNVELGRTNYHSHNKQAKLIIDDEFIQDVHHQDRESEEIQGLQSQGVSNGFLGNTHEVKVSENTNTSVFNAQYNAIDLHANPSNRITFVGDDDLRSDIGVVLDSNSKTWFEYEVCNIHNALKFNPCEGYGFNVTLGRADGGVLEIPWYKFHEKGALQALEDQSFFPPPANTGGTSPYDQYFDPQSGQYILGGGTSDPYGGTISNSEKSASMLLKEQGAPKQGGVLKLVISAHFQGEPKMSYISIQPKIISGKIPKIKTVEVKASNENRWVKATQIVPPAQKKKLKDFNPNSNEDIVEDNVSSWYFPEQHVKQARIVIEQHRSYDTKIGHLVWTSEPLYKNNKKGSPVIVNVGSLVSNSPITGIDDLERVDGPGVSLEKLVATSNDSKGKKKNQKAEPDTSSLDHSSTSVAVPGHKKGTPDNNKNESDLTSGHNKKKSLHKIGSVLGLIPDIKNYLSGSKYNATSYKYDGSINGPYLEYFKGWRYAIGVSAIDFGLPVYEHKSLLLTKDNRMPMDIKIVQLTVNENYPTGNGFKKETEWIEYSFSLDGGHSWHHIAPASHFDSPHHKIFNINPIQGEDSIDEHEGVIHTQAYDPLENPVTQIRLRAELKRPHHKDGLSPHLLSYQLIVQGLRFP